MASLRLCVLAPAAPAPAALPQQINDGLVLPLGARADHSEFPLDPVAGQQADGTWQPPVEGGTIQTTARQPLKWRKVSAGTNGWFAGPGLRGGYLFASLHADQDQPALLEAAGHEMVYVNGAPRIGDIYSSEITLLPVQLRAGENQFLFQTGRGRLKARLLPVHSRALFNPRDMTLPDFHPENPGNMLGAVIVLNTSAQALRGVQLRVTGPDGRAALEDLPPIPPSATRKIPFPIRTPSPLPSVPNLAFRLALEEKSTGAVLDEAAAVIRVLSAEQPFKTTFRSAIDGSVQYYAVHPIHSSGLDRGAPALFLSLHGAGVEALGQAQAYSPKSWGWLVAPTNRRPYGFDWEDWGRRDAIEVLDLAAARFQTDPSRTYLTGHSMGGHGAWQVGVTFPARFAAVAPSAGWISFSSYAGKRRSTSTNAIASLFARANSPGDTLLLRSNYLHHGVYILHGGADDNVPPSEARAMRDTLAKFHHDFTYFEQPGAGHWWDASDEPGADCVDWAPFFDFFARHRVPADSEVRQINFSTANPAVSSQSHWVSIDLQEKALEKSSITLRFDPGQRRFVGGSENVARLRIDLSALAAQGRFSFELDGQSLTNLPVPNDRFFWLERKLGQWMPAAPAALQLKNARRCGPFKEAFGREMVFVYGASGTAEENRWALEKARYDAELFWYCGNGSIEVIPDTDWNPARYRDRSVVLYGHADSNRAWRNLLSGSPIQARRGKLTIGSKEIEGSNLAALFVRPRPDSNLASVAVVTGTGPSGFRLCDRLPYLMPGTGYPDWAVFGPEAMSEGADGVRAAGYFGPDWTIETGDSAWR